MPLWLLKMLPNLMIGVAIIGFIAWIDHNAAERTKARLDAQAKAIENNMRSELRRSEQRLAIKVIGLGDDMVAVRADLDRTRAALAPTVAKEIAHAPRLSDPAAGLTPGLLAAVNSARQAGACPTTATGQPGCTLPSAAARSEPDDRSAGQGRH